MEIERMGSRAIAVALMLCLCAPAGANDLLFPRGMLAFNDGLVAGEGVVLAAYPGAGAAERGSKPAVDFAAEWIERRTIRIEKGQTISEILHAEGVSRQDAAAMVKALRGHADLRRLQVGQKVTLYLSPLPRPGIGLRLVGLVLDLGRRGAVVAYRDFDHGFAARRTSHDDAVALLESIVVVHTGDGSGNEDGGFITRDVALRKGQSLYRLLIGNGASQRDAYAAANMLGKQIDARRLHIGQIVTVMFETLGGSRASRLTGVALELPDGRTALAGRAPDGRWHPAPPQTSDAAAADAGSAPLTPPVSERVDTTSPDPVESITAEAAMPSGAAASPRKEMQTIILRRGDRLFDRLTAAGATRKDADRAVGELGKIINLRRLQIGEQFQLTFTTVPGQDRARLTGLSVDTKRKDLIVLRWPLETTGDGTLSARSGTRSAPSDAGEADDLPPVVAHDVLPLSRELRLVEVERGGSLFRLLSRAGAPSSHIGNATRSLRRIFNPDRLRVGQQLIIDIDHADGRVVLEGFTLQTGRKAAVAVKRNERGHYTAHQLGAAAFANAVALFEAQTAARALASQEGGRPPEVAQAGPAPDSLIARVNGQALTDLSGGLRTTVVLERGATLMKTLVNAGSERREAHAAIEAVRELHNPRRLRAGQSVTVTFVAASPNDIIDGHGENSRLGGVSLALSPETSLDVVRLDDGGYVSGFVERQLTRDYSRVEGTIDTSLYEAVEAAAVPFAVLMDLVRIYSFDVDFQRDIQRGDQFEILYEVYFDDQGAMVKTGDILFAEMTLSGRLKPLYRHETRDGRVDYFDAVGLTARKALMRTPIDGARLSSRFGKRKHPILGYSKMHKGIDFAARPGTPVYAAGDGVVERASRYGTYGNYIRIRHNADYATAYAHLLRFAKGLYPGKRVQQGETIGYVGSTGRSTGPHLHYEVLYRGRHVNPLSVRLPTGVKLSDAELAAFERQRERVAELLQRLPKVRNVAEK